MLPRVTFLADAGAAGGRAGWAAICRLVSATQLAGERGKPVVDLSLVAPWLESGDVTVLLGPASEVGAALARPGRGTTWPGPRWRRGSRSSRGRTSSSSWSPTGCHTGVRLRWGPGTTPHAARMAGFARAAGLGAVLTNAVRYADRRDAPVVDVLDAARRLVALDTRHVDRGNAEGFLKSGKQMHEVAEEIARLAGLGATPTARPTGCWPGPGWWATGAPSTRAPTSGWGRSTSRSSTSRPLPAPTCGPPRRPARPPTTCSAPGARPAIGRRYGSAPRQRIWKRLDDELEMIRGLGYASYFLTVGDVTDLIREMGVRCAGPRLGRGQPGQLPARHLRGRPDPPRAADGAVPLPAARLAARHRRRRRVRPA